MDDQNNPTIPAQDSYQPPMPSMTPTPEPTFTPATPMTETTTTTTQPSTSPFGEQAMTTTSTTTSVPLATAMPTTPADITPPVVPVVSEAQWPESKPKSKMPQVLGGIAAIILVVGVATAAYFVSIRVSGQLAVAPTAPTSEPFAFNQKDIVKLGSAKAQKEYYDALDAKARAATALGQYFAANPTAAGNLDAVDKLIAEGAAKGGTLIGTDKGQLVGCEAIYVDVCNKYDQRTAGGTVFVTAADAALYWLQVGQALDWTYGDPTHPTVKVPKGYYPCAGGNFCKIGSTSTVTSSGKGGGGTTTVTTTCTEQCPGTDGVLRSCTPPEADGSSADSLCAWAGRVETCGGKSYCCPAPGGTWTADMTKCTTITVTSGACTEIKLYAKLCQNVTGQVACQAEGYSTTPMTDTEKAALKVGYKIRIAITGSKADLKARFRVFVNDVVEATGDTAEPQWRLGQSFSGADHLTTYYSDYEIKSSGSYKFEGQVTTKAKP